MDEKNKGLSQHDVMEILRKRLAGLASKRFTGEINFRFHMAQGGFSRIYQEEKREVAK